VTQGASPEQYLTAAERRGYSREYLAQPCTCGCPRAAHAKRAEACRCGCDGFRQAPPAQPQAESAPTALRQRYILGTLPAPGSAAPPEPERPDVATHTDITESGILRAIAADEVAAREAGPVDPVVILDPTDAPALVTPREGTATRCPFCLADDFESIPSVKCPSCKAWQHAECVREVRRCAACNADWNL
jgi:hypothetical protein